MKPKSKVLKYFLLGLTFDVLIIVVLCLSVLISSLHSYAGKCPDIFFATYDECARSDYVSLNFIWLFIALVVVGWWISLPLLLAPPLVGVLLGSYKSRKNDELHIYGRGDQ